MSRPAGSLLRSVWQAIESQAATHPDCINTAIHKIRAQFPQQLASPPDPRQDEEWKAAVRAVTNGMLGSWVRQKRELGGRTAAYGLLTEHRLATAAVNREHPIYLRTRGLTKSEKRNIAAIRVQCTAWMASHAQHRDTSKFGRAAPYRGRYCVMPCCDGRGLLDDAIHILLQCPWHRRERRELFGAVNAQLGAAVRLDGATSGVRRLEDLAGDHMRIRLLLGAPDLEHLQSPDSRRYQRILQAVSTFLRAVYRERWVERS